MKLRLVFLSLLAMAASARAGSYSFAPTPSDLGDLDHHLAYSWGFNASSARTDLQNGLKVTEATITISNIRNWNDLANILHINLLDGARSGVRTETDNAGDVYSISQNFFSPSSKNSGEIQYSASFPLTQWTDDLPGNALEQFSFQLSSISGALSMLESYILSDSYGRIGLGFDPDCHYYNSGVSFVIKTDRVSVPDAGSTFALLGFGLSAIAFLRRRIL